MTHGSWASFPVLLRTDAHLVARLEGLVRNPALMDTGLFAADGIGRVVEEHVTGRAKHTKLLLQLLTMASWLGAHSYSAVVADG